MALNSTCVLRRRRRTTASGKLGACDTRSAASCAVYAAGCMLCVLSVACCNCVLQRRRGRLPVESVGPTTRASQARLHVQAGGDGRNGCAHPIDIPILAHRGPAHTEGALGCGRGLMADDRRSTQGNIACAMTGHSCRGVAARPPCCMLHGVRCPLSLLSVHLHRTLLRIRAAPGTDSHACSSAICGACWVQPMSAIPTVIPSPAAKYLPVGDCR